MQHHLGMGPTSLTVPEPVRIGEWVAAVYCCGFGVELSSVLRCGGNCRHVVLADGLLYTTGLHCMHDAVLLTLHMVARWAAQLAVQVRCSCNNQ
jgi:hypothetical protein